MQNNVSAQNKTYPRIVQKFTYLKIEEKKWFQVISFSSTDNQFISVIHGGGGLFQMLNRCKNHFTLLAQGCELLIMSLYTSINEGRATCHICNHNAILRVLDGKLF